MAPPAPDPSGIRSIAVTAGDVVAAIEARHTSDREVVLRITPPFSGRMRARLHDADAALGPADTGAVHVAPETLLAPSAPTYPSSDETARELRTDPDCEYDRSIHRERHVAAVDRWREAIVDSVRESVTLQTPAGPVDVEVSVLQ